MKKKKRKCGKFFVILFYVKKALCANPAVRDFILAEMNKTGKEQKLKGFEFAK